MNTGAHEKQNGDDGGRRRLGPVRLGLILLRQQAHLAIRSVTRPSVVRHHGVKLAIGPHLTPTLVRSIYSGEYERYELSGIGRHLEKGDVVMELGTGLGFVSLFCAGRIGEDKVHTYEANPALEPFIRENFQLNNLNPHLNVAFLGDEEGEQTFYIEENFWSSSSTPRSEQSRPVQTPKRKLNDEIRRIAPTFLIVDIEGGEHDIFQIIDFQSIRKVAVELHERIIGAERTRAVRDRLLQAGFRVAHESPTRENLVYVR